MIHIVKRGSKEFREKGEMALRKAKVQQSIKKTDEHNIL